MSEEEYEALDECDLDEDVAESDGDESKEDAKTCAAGVESISAATG